MVRLAAIGIGGRLSGMLGGMCREFGDDVKLVAAVDPDADRVRQRLERAKLDSAAVRFYPSVDALLENCETFDGIAIGTRCHLHTPMAVKVAPVGLPVFMEKPVAISPEQLSALRQAYRGREDSVVVSFPLRVTSTFAKAKELLDSGRIGTVNQIQAVNNVTYGGGYYGGWYRNFEQVGGLWLQKATHDFDYLTCLVGAHPVMLAAMMTRKVYGGTKPHDLWCSKCDIADTCPESAKNLKARGDTGGMSAEDHPCCFSAEIRNQDAGSALIHYADNTIVSYDQNFISRRSAGRRGATIIGFKGTIEFDWYAQKVRLIEHHGSAVEEFDCKSVGGHGGGDYHLQRSFVQLVRGEGPSVADLRAGLLSVTMCLAARESCHSNTFQRVPLFDGTELPPVPIISGLER